MAKPKDFKSLQEKWYKKLEKSGFKDAEDSQENLHTWSYIFSRNCDKHKELMLAKQTYYRMATNFLNDYNFESNLDKVIWEYHANGISVRDIAKLLKKAKVLNITGAGIHKGYIKRLRDAMKAMYIVR